MICAGRAFVMKRLSSNLKLFKTWQVKVQSWKNADQAANFEAPLAGVSVNE
jgi:hypothetical protein